MKKNILFILVLVTFLSLNNVMVAQEPPHPPDTGHGIGGNSPASNSAPIDGGILTLVALAAFYTGNKIRLQQKEDE